MAHTLFHPDISNAAGVELRQELVVVDTDLSLIHKRTHASEAHTQACTGTQMRLFLHPSHRIEKNDTKPIFGAIILFPADSDFSLHCQELISPSLLLLLTVLLSICLLASTPPLLASQLLLPSLVCFAWILTAAKGQFYM